jgi:hypothetical protein
VQPLRLGNDAVVGDEHREQRQRAVEARLERGAALVAGRR